MIKESDSRTRTARKNAIISALFKIIGLGCTLAIVPLTIGYLNKEVYGIWLVLSSMLYWIAFFDFGFGNGMRNYLTQAISENDFRKGKCIVSTSFLFLSSVAIACALICTIIFPFLDFNDIFNTTVLPTSELSLISAVAISFTLVTFVVKNIGYIFVALQKYALHDALTVGGSVLSLIAVALLTITTEPNLLYVVTAFTAMPVFVYLISSIPIFSVYSYLRPSLKHIDLQFGKLIVSKGLGFFVIQITSCLVVFGCANFFIAQYCGPAEVTVYNIAYRYFNLLAIAFTVVISPLWNAYTDAYVKSDFDWIRQTFHRSLRIWGLTVIVGIGMLCICSPLYDIWIGNSVEVPFEVSVATLAYICCFNLNNSVTYLLNGLNKIRVQIITSIVGTGFFVCTILLFGNELGTYGIVASMAICYLLMASVHIYQCRLLTTQKATGVWNR